MIKKIVALVCAFGVNWACAACPTAQTKFNVYTGLPTPPPESFATSSAQATYLRYANLNKKIVPDKSFVMIDLDDLVFPIPIEAVKPVRLNYLMDWNKTYEIPYEVDYGNGNVVTQWQTVTAAGPYLTLVQSDSTPQGTLADYKIQLLNIDTVGQGCPSVLFTTNTLIAESLPTNTAYFGNFMLGFNSSGQVARVIELDARFGTVLGLGNTDASVELADINGDGKLDLVIRRGGVVAYAFQGSGSGATQNFQMDPFSRKSQDILALRQVWKEFQQLAHNRDSRATAYFSEYFIKSHGAALGQSGFLLALSDGLIDSDIVEISSDTATYGAVYTTPSGNALELFHFTRDHGGAWKINDF